jgi:hypothetical protein
MLGYLGNTEQLVRVEVFEGKDQLPDYLTTLVLRPGFENLKALAVVRDADDDARASLASVIDHISRTGLTAPDGHGKFASATSHDGRRRAVGVFVSPDGVAPGALESLFLQSITDGPIVTCVREFLRCIGSELRHTRAAQLAKVEFHAWLATSPQPGILPGQALDANYIIRDSVAFDPIKRFLTELMAAARASD